MVKLHQELESLENEKKDEEKEIFLRVTFCICREVDLDTHSGGLWILKDAEKN